MHFSDLELVGEVAVIPILPAFLDLEGTYLSTPYKANIIGKHFRVHLHTVYLMCVFLCVHYPVCRLFGRVAVREDPGLPVLVADHGR